MDTVREDWPAGGADGRSVGGDGDLSGRFHVDGDRSRGGGLAGDRQLPVPVPADAVDPADLPDHACCSSWSRPLALVRVVSGPLRPMAKYVDLFFMGAAFLLLETKSVVQFALLFGTTWFVNALVFAGVLVSVLAAIEVARRWRPARPELLYVALLAALAVAWVVPVEFLLGLEMLPRFLLAVVIWFTPIFIANLVFAERFRNVEESNVAFGANLLGAMVGGLLEYVALLTGYQALLLLVAVLYGAAFLTGRVHLREGVATSPARVELPHHMRMPPWERLARIVALAVIIAIGIFNVYMAVTHWTLSDADAYWQAGLRLRAGEPLYPALSVGRGLGDLPLRPVVRVAGGAMDLSAGVAGRRALVGGAAGRIRAGADAAGAAPRLDPGGLLRPDPGRHQRGRQRPAADRGGAGAGRGTAQRAPVDRAGGVAEDLPDPAGAGLRRPAPVVGFRAPPWRSPPCSGCRRSSSTTCPRIRFRPARRARSSPSRSSTSRSWASPWAPRLRWRRRAGAG